jgi:hypothetical protein
VSFLVSAAGADEALLKPFVLGSRGPGTVAEKTAAVKTALTGQGFAIVGEYTPYPDAAVIVATNDELRSNAAKSEHGGFGAAVRISVTRTKDEVQVAYTNPHTWPMHTACRETCPMSQQARQRAGQKREFGAKGLTAKKLRSYHICSAWNILTSQRAGRIRQF